MKRYEAYKDSGVDWIGEIPEDWFQEPFSSVFSLKSIINNKNEELLSVYLNKGVIKFSDVGEKRTNVTSEDLSKYQLVEEGDFVINNQQAWRGSVGVSFYRGIVSPAYIVLAIKNNFDFRFLNYLLRNRSFVTHYLLCSKGVGTIQRNLYWPQLKRVYLIFPSLEEQQTIANFLDDKTAKIDQLIGIKQKEIELLKERRQILIQQAVTKGLDATVPMKDSGVDWIGEIPEHWEVRKLKYIGNMFSGLTNKKGDDFSKEPKEGFSPFIPFTNIFRNNKISEDEFQFVRSNQYDVQNVVENNDILFLMSSETFDDIGKNSIYLGKTKVFLNSFCKGFKIYDKNINPLFINFMLLSKNYREYFASVGRGFTRINIKQEYVLDMPILYLPLHEQVQITTHLEEIEAIITKAILLKQQEIEKLKEYKTVLIDNVVTGKVKID